MAPRGRKPKPARLKILTGNAGRRPIKPELEPAPGATCPADLSEGARAVWARVAPELERLGLLNVLTGETLAGYCDAYARWVQATAEIAKTGEVVKAPSGYPVQNPWRAIANKAHEQWTKLAAEFGMTPSAMTRMGVTPATKEDVADEFFFGTGKGKLAKYLTRPGA